MQLFFVGVEWHDILAAIIGSSYGILGFLLIVKRKNKVVAYIAIIFPIIGGCLGFVRLLTIEIAVYGEVNWFIVWHIIADAIVSPCCAYSYIKLAGFDKNKSIDFITIVLYDITAFIHILLPVQYGFGNVIAVGASIYGFIYLTTAILLWIKKSNKQSSIIALVITIIGLIVGTVGLFVSPTPFLVFFIILDVVLIILRGYLFTRIE